MKILRHISRLIAAVVFIFSGFVKGVDPLGTAYRLEDYFLAYNMEWAGAMSLVLSISLCAIEFIIGMALLLNLRMKTTSWALLLIMVFFTLLTLYDAIYEPVSDCGCFGDAIILTNWETFYKNVVLMVFTLIVFVQRNRFQSVLSGPVQNGLLLFFALGFISFSIYNYRHLPMIDFRPWKVGNQMTQEQQVEVYLKYRHIETGETREYLSPDYPWDDSVWMAEWEFVEQRQLTHGEFIDHGLYVTDQIGEEHTDEILHNPDYLFVGISYDIGSAPERGLHRLFGLQALLEQESIRMVLLTASLPEEVITFREQYSIHTDVYYVDGITLKTMIRANPGLMLFKDGQVLGKWHYRDIPQGHQQLDWIRNILQD